VGDIVGVVGTDVGCKEGEVDGDLLGVTVGREEGANVGVREGNEVEIGE
jgi:hypothetical protein